MEAVALFTSLGAMTLRPYARDRVVVKVAPPLIVSGSRVDGWVELERRAGRWKMPSQHEGLGYNLRQDGRAAASSTVAAAVVTAVSDAVRQWAEKNDRALGRASRECFNAARRAWMMELRSIAQGKNESDWSVEWSVGDPDLIAGAPQLRAEIDRFHVAIANLRAGARELATSLSRAKFEPRAASARSAA